MVDKRVLYITFDGLLEPLGQSQVLKYVCGLARRGVSHIILSLERAPDLHNKSRVEATERELTSAGVTWVRGIYHGRTLRNVVDDCVQAYRNACSVVDTMPVACIHARSYPAALVSFAGRVTRSVPYIFDMRGNWVEEKAAQRGWPKGRFLCRCAKQLERLLLKRSSSIVTLTEVHADDLRRGYSKFMANKSLTVIPTCCDYEAFATKRGLDCVPRDTSS